MFQNGGCDAGFFGDKLLGIECTLEASVSNLPQYKIFIGDDKNNMPFGVTFSFKQYVNLENCHPNPPLLNAAGESIFCFCASNPGERFLFFLNSQAKNFELIRRSMSPELFDFRVKSTLAKTSEKGYGDGNECPSQRGPRALSVPLRDEFNYMPHGVVAFNL